MRTILRNIFSNWIGYVVTTLIGFFLSPFVIHRLGNTGYGVWTLVLSLTGYFGLLDLGIRSSVGRFVARSVALKDEHQVNRTVSTSLAILGTAGLMALVATVVLNFTIGHFKIDSQYVGPARLALAIAGVNVSLALPLSVFGAVLVSIERYDVVTAVTVSGALTRAALIVGLLRLHYGLVALALVTLLEGLAEYTAMGICAKRLYRPLRIGWRSIHLANCKELFSFGVYRFLWIIANQLIFYTDSVVIGAFLNAGAITYYAIGGSIIAYGRHVVTLATDPLYPVATRLDSQKDLAGLQELEILGTRIGLLLAIPICLGFVFLGKQFITLWVGPEYGISVTVLAVLTIPQLTSMSQYVSALILAGMAKHRILAYLALGEGLANLTLSIILVRRMGLIGVAWGTVIPHLISTAIVIPAYTLRILNMSPLEFVARGFIRPLACGIPVAILFYILSEAVTNATWPIFLGEVISVCAVFALIAYFVCLTAGQRAAITDRVRNVFSREIVAHEA